MLRALSEFEIGGVKTLVGFHRALLEHVLVAGETCHGVVESGLAERAEQLSHRTTAGVALQPDSRLRASPGSSSSTAAASVQRPGARAGLGRAVASPSASGRAPERTAQARRDAVVSPMQGTVLAVEVAEGDEVAAGQVICVVEAMKMENEVHAHRDGVVRELTAAVGALALVSTGQLIYFVEAT